MHHRPTRAPALRSTALRAAVLAALLPLIAPTEAATATWIGGGPGAPNSWANALNWQGLQRPVSAADTVILFPNSFVAAVNDIGENFQFNRLSAFAAGGVGLSGTLLGQSLAPAGADAQIAVGSGGTLAINASLVGGGAWSKTGAGELALGGVNVGSSGEITVAAGRLTAATSGTLGTGAITVASGASLRTGGTQNVGGIAGAGSWQAAGIVTLSPTSGTRSFAGSVAGTAALNKTGAGRQAFSGNVALANTVNVAGGELALDGASARLVGTTIGTVSNGALASLSGGAQWSLVGGVNVSSAGGSTSTLSLRGASSVTGLSAVIGNLVGERGRVTVDSNSTFTNAGELTVAFRGVGSLEVGAGGRVSANALAMAADSVSANGSLVLGAGSSASFVEAAAIGTAGQATVSVGPDASFTSASAELGRLPLGRGLVTVAGDGSRFTTGTLQIGSGGLGTLGVDRGVVISGTGELGGAAGATGIATLENGAFWTVGGNLVVGAEGTGSLTMNSNARLDSGKAALGFSPGSSGSASLNGGARWTIGGTLLVGNGGNGRLTISGGASVTSAGGTVGVLREAGPSPGFSNVHLDNGTWRSNGMLLVGDRGVGTITMLDASRLFSDGAEIGRLAGSEGGVSLGAGSSWTNSGTLVIGSVGLGTLYLAGGTTVSTGQTFIGETGGVGSVLMDGLGGGARPVMAVDGSLVVGRGGTGSIEIREGLLRSGTGSIGTSTTGSGLVSLTGVAPGDASWLISGDLFVGALAPGVLKVGSSNRTGEVVASGEMAIRATGTVQLQRGLLSVGRIGPDVGGRFDWTGGTLAITGPDGAELGSTSYLGRVLVLRGDQALQVTKRLQVGDGTIVLTDQAQVRAGVLSLAGGTITGTVPLALPGGVTTGHGVITNRVTALGTSSLVMASGGTLTVGDANQVDGYVNRGPSVATDGSRLVLASASLVTLGDGSGMGDGAIFQTLNGALLPAASRFSSSGAATVLGRFTNNGSVRAGSADGERLTFNDDVDGSGSFVGAVRFNQRFTPGAGTRLQTLDLASTATLVLADGGAAARADAPLFVDSTAWLAGALDLRLDAGFVPSEGATLTLIDWGGFSGRFDRFSLTGLDAAWIGRLDYGDDALRLSVTAVPEPATVLLMLGGTALLLMRRR